MTAILQIKLMEGHGNKVPHQQISKVEYKPLMYSTSNSIVCLKYYYTDDGTIISSVQIKIKKNARNAQFAI